MHNCELFCRYTFSPEGIWFLCPQRILHLGTYRAFIFPFSVRIWRPFLASLAHSVASRGLAGGIFISLQLLCSQFYTIILHYINGLHAVHTATIFCEAVQHREYSVHTGNILYAHFTQHTTSISFWFSAGIPPEAIPWMTGFLSESFEYPSSV